MGKDKERERARAIKAATESIEKQHGKGSIMLLGDRSQAAVPCISAGAPVLDAALGGGYPIGRIVEIYGPESSGKTTLTLHAIAECQKKGGVAAFVDAEHALDVRYAQALGVQPGSLLISQPDCGEQALDIVDALVRSAGIDLIVIDSVAALVPKAEIEGEMGDQQMGLQARLMSKALRKLTGLANRTETTVIFINQLRQKIGQVFGNPETTTGGNALKFYCSCRLDVRRIGAVKSGEDIIGNRTRVKVVKNKLAAPYLRAEFDIRYGEGIDIVGELLDTAVSSNVIDKSGSFYSFKGERIAQGREKARVALIADEVLRKAVAETMQKAA